MEHFVVQIGVMMAAAAAFAVVLRMFKQSTILAYIAVGVLASSMDLELSAETVHAFSETGIILLLFMAGLEVNLTRFIRRWKLLLTVGLGQIVLNCLLGCLVGFLVIDINQAATLIYFGLCLTLSSTIVVLGLLKVRKEMESLHGQLILGLMVLQDIVAVLAIAVLKSLSSGAALVPALGLLFAKLIGLALALYVVSRFLLRPLFRRFAASAEMLFIGAMGWALGMAALGELIHFSPEIAAFMAGVALSILPYKLEIEDKVEPIKSFGVVLFFIALGYQLDLGPEVFELATPILVSVALAVVGTLPLMVFLGYLTRLKSHPSFMMGGIINQISEFSLILATLCLNAGVFQKHHFLIVTLACVLSILLSSVGHQFLPQIYRFLARMLGFLDKRAFSGATEQSGHSDHVVLFGHNEMSTAISEHMKERDHAVLVIHLDPDAHAAITLNASTDAIPVYADVYDPDTWDEAGIKDAALIVSCLPDDQHAELSVLHWMKRKGITTPFVAATNSSAEALELYEAGASFVVQADEIVGAHLKSLFSGADAFDFSSYGQAHHERLSALRLSKPENFQFL
jgi:Kef-type K+ transport system membrane component KefB/Trk K+ transport system NAD-binding subunit